MYSGGGGLCFCSAVAIFASASSDVIAAEKTLHDFRNQLNRIYWDICCCETERAILTDANSAYKWILDNYYKDSRTKVIGKAIADCITHQNEFAGKKAEDIITC